MYLDIPTNISHHLIENCSTALLWLQWPQPQLSGTISYFCILLISHHFTPASQSVKKQKVPNMTPPSKAPLVKSSTPSVNPPPKCMKKDPFSILSSISMAETDAQALKAKASISAQVQLHKIDSRERLAQEKLALEEWNRQCEHELQSWELELNCQQMQMMMNIMSSCMSQQQAMPSGGENLFGMMQGGTSRMDLSGQANLNFTQENGLGNSNTTFNLNGAGNDIYGAGAGDS